MEKNQKEFSFDDIKVGDKLQVTNKYPYGSEVIIVGVAAYQTTYNEWKTQDNVLLTEAANPARFERKLLLLDRPSMPVKIGTIVSAVLKASGERVNLARVEPTSDGDKLVWLELAGDGQAFHGEADILQWHEMKLVAA